MSGEALPGTASGFGVLRPQKSASARFAQQMSFSVLPSPRRKA